MPQNNKLSEREKYQGLINYLALKEQAIFAVKNDFGIQKNLLSETFFQDGISKINQLVKKGDYITAIFILEILQFSVESNDFLTYRKENLMSIKNAVLKEIESKGVGWGVVFSESNCQKAVLFNNKKISQNEVK